MEIFKDDFENGYVPWDGAVADTGCVIEVSPTHAVLGTYSSHMKNRTEQRGQAYCYKGFASQDIVYHAFYVYIAEDAGTIYAFLGGFTHYLPTPNLAIGVDGPDRHLVLWFDDATGTHMVSSSFTLALNRTYFMEIGVDKTKGEIRVWVKPRGGDLVEVTDLKQTGLDLSGQAYHQIFNGIVAAWRYLDCYFDAVVVSDSFIEPLPEVIKYATLAGTVSDINGKPIEGAVVTAKNIFTGAEFSGTTDASGAYSFTVPCDVYDVTASATGYKTSDPVRVNAETEAVYTVNFTLTPAPIPPPMEVIVEKDFSDGSWAPLTANIENGGTQQFFTPATDPLGTGEYGVINRQGDGGGRCGGILTTEKQYGIVRVTQVVAFPKSDQTTNNDIGVLVLRHHSLWGTPWHLFMLRVWDQQWRTIYNNNGEDVYGDYPSIRVEQNRKYKVTVELKMGHGDGEARLWIDDVLVWERTGLVNDVRASTIDIVETASTVATSPYQESYLYYLKIEGAEKHIYTLTGRCVDAITGNAVPYCGVRLGHADGYIVGGICDANGYFNITVPEGFYEDLKILSLGYGDPALPVKGITHIKNIDLTRGNLDLGNIPLQPQSPSEPTPVPTGKFWELRGVTVFHYFQRYSSTAYDEVLDDLLSYYGGLFNTVVIRVWWTNAPGDPQIPIFDDRDGATSWSELAAAVDKAHARGLKVMLVHAGTPGRQLDKSRPDRWFPAYKQLCIDIGNWAQEHGVEYFVFAAESGWGCKWATQYDTTTTDIEAYWIDILQAIRSVYKGKVGYNEVYDPDPTYSGTWWKNLDFLWQVLSWVRLTYKLDPTEAEVVDGWYNPPDWGWHWRHRPGGPPFKNPMEVCKYFADLGIPVVFNNGPGVQDGCCMTPWGDPSNIPDREEHALFYKVFFNVWKDIPLLGCDLEHYDAKSDPTTTIHNIRGTHAEGFIKAGLAAVSLQIPSGKGALEVHAFTDTKEVAATVEIVGVETKTTPFVTYLDPGNYTLNAKYDTQTQTRTTTIVEGQVTREDFHFIAPPPTPPKKPTGILVLWGFPICSRFPNLPPCPIILNWAKRMGYIKEGA